MTDCESGLVLGDSRLEDDGITFILRWDTHNGCGPTPRGGDSAKASLNGAKDVKNGVGSGLGFAWALAPHYHRDRLGDSLPCSRPVS